MTTNARLPVQLSDDAYENINFLPLISSNASRITYVFTTDIVSSDPCQAFHDIEFMIDDNGIKRFAEVTVTKIASLMKLIPSPNWQFRPYPDSNGLKANLVFRHSELQFIGMATTLVHSGRFTPSDGRMPEVLGYTQGQDCFFGVRYQYFVRFNAPTLIHIVVLDVTARCGTRLKSEMAYDPRSLDRARLKAWLDTLKLERDYHELLNDQAASSLIGGMQSIDSLKRARNSESYKAFVDHCRQTLNDKSSNTAGVK